MVDDQHSIETIIEAMESAWNRGDSGAFSAAFADDAEFVDILGEYHRGREDIQEGHRQIFETIYKGSRVVYTLERIRFVQPDVAVVFVRQVLLSGLVAAADDPNRAAYLADTMREDKARPMIVLAKQNGDWRIVTFQNTRIARR